MSIRVLAPSLIWLSFTITAVAVQIRGKTEVYEEEVNLVRSEGAKSGKPNIVWILADDLHYEPGVLLTMPNIRRLKHEGIEFPNHVSQSPLCGPSRASLLVGRLPHNSGYKSNAAQASVYAFRKIQHDTVGKWLTDAGYYTVFLGKYVNAIMQHWEDMPKGWRHWGAFTEGWDWYKQNWLGGAYTYYNASQWDLSYDEKGNLIKKNNSDYPINIWTDLHQADLLATQTLDHATTAINMGKPFFIFTNPTMIHHGYCHHPVKEGTQADDDPYNEEYRHLGAISPCVKKEHTQAYLKSIVGDFLLHRPTSAYNKTALGQGPAAINCCDSSKEERMAIGRRNRTASLLDLDDMLGAIVSGLKKMNVLGNTYIFFTSDNGYHLGQHKFWYGKELPYDHDVRVPLVVRAPAGNSGVSNLPSSHVDITATIVDLAGAEKFLKLPLDGKSFAKSLRQPVRVKSWREFSFSEMFESDGKTWRNIRHVDAEGIADWSMNVWCNGDVEIYRLQKSDALGDGDTQQLINRFDPGAGNASNIWAQGIFQAWLPVINGMGICSGSSCNSAEDVKIDINDPAKVMKCEDNKRMMDVSFDGSPILHHAEGWD